MINLAPTDRILQRLAALHPKLIDLDLGRIERLLQRLGNPEYSCPPILHVAGTNGKGSVIAYLRAIYEAAGKSVHVYTSPHLVRFHERIRLNGALISDQALEQVLEECEAANDGAPITLFEITTAAAFLAFSRHPADYLLLETGLGGRLDATNVIADPLATIIMPVSLDHQQHLGETIGQIAYEKAGIIKSRIPVIMAEQSPQSAAIIEKVAAQKNAPVVRYGFEYFVARESTGFRYKDGKGDIPLPMPALPGAHQIGNAAAALACLRTLGDAQDPFFAPGLQKAEWPARLQRLRKGPMMALIGGQDELWLDGGHNEAAAEILANHIAHHSPQDVHLVFGMIRTKAPKPFLRHFIGRVNSISCLTIEGEHDVYAADELSAIARRLGFEAVAEASPYSALARITQCKGDRRKIVLICGSLYLAGRILYDHE